MGWSEFFDDLELIAGQKITVNDGDYLNADGLWMCGKCNTPKQSRIEVLGEVRTPMCLCQCEQDKQNAEVEEAKRLKKANQIEMLRNDGFPDAEMRRFRFDTDDGKNPVSEVARRYVENFEQMLEDGKGLLLFGSVGTGKTFIAACIANALIDKCIPCLVTNFSRITNTLTGMYEGKQSYIDSLNRYDLLIIDDLATERDTEYMNEIVFNIIDARSRVNKPLIVTTNLTAEELKRPAEVRKQRIYSRLFEMCIPVEVKGKDRRKEVLREDMSKYSDLLGLGVANG